MGIAQVGKAMLWDLISPTKPVTVTFDPLPDGFVAPCLPTRAARPPSGPDWLHEIKHDGMRLIARKDHTGVRLYSRSGNDVTGRFTMIVGAFSRLDVRSAIIDGEAVAFRDGVASRELLREGTRDDHVFLFAFDLIELEGDDLRPLPLEERKVQLEQLVGRAEIGMQLTEFDDGDGELVYKDACAAGAEGIVSKRKGTHYEFGRSEHWLKIINKRRARAQRRVDEASRR